MHIGSTFIFWYYMVTDFVRQYAFRAILRRETLGVQVRRMASLLH